MASSSEKNLESYLRYGCLITLRSNKNYAHSVGFIDDSLYVSGSSEIDDFSHAVFRIIPQCSQPAQIELINKCKNESDTLSSSIKEKISNLNSELKDNLETYEKLKGQPISFGSLVFLQHVQSHQFLTVVPGETSPADKDSLRVSLKNFPDENSYIRLESSYNYQKEGKAYIKSTDIVVLEVSLKTKLVFISISDKKVKFSLGKHNCRQLNGCLDKRSKWQINLYMPVNFENSKIINCGEYIWINQSEGKGVLIASSKSNSTRVYFDSRLNNCNGIWEIENKDFTKSSHVLADENYRIKHLSTGLYLSLERNDDNEFNLILSSQSSDLNLWRFEQIQKKKVNSKVYSEQFYSLSNDKVNLKLQAIENENDCLGIYFSDDSSESSYLKILRVDSNSLWESQFTKSCIPLLKSMNPLITKYKAKKTGVDYVMIRKFKKKVGTIEKCLKSVKNFVKNKLQNSVSIGKYYGFIDAVRQKSLKELGIIDTLAKVLKLTFSDEFLITKLFLIQKEKDSNHNTYEDSEKFDAQKEFNLALLRSITSIIQMIYKLIAAACAGNLENMHYARKYFIVFQTHAGYHLGATKCMSRIIFNNEALLYSLLRQKSNQSIYVRPLTIIDHYIWLLKVNFI